MKVSAAARSAGSSRARSRPGHFDGVLTVVAKLLGDREPAARRLRAEGRPAGVPGAADGAPTSTSRRASMWSRPCAGPDGLALSSRNRYLTATPAAPRVALSRPRAAASSSDRGIDAVLAAAQSVLMDEDLVKLDYLEGREPADLPPGRRRLPRPAPAMLIAAQVGTTRLIDNDAASTSN